jgi:DNA-directed RNA polymerase subunit RPC12/RpoP
MIDTLLNLMFRCSHRRLTSPLTPVSKAGVPHGETYVVCLDCGKQFSYDLNAMRIGKAIDHSHDACIVPAVPPKARHGKLKYAILASVPLAVVLGAALHSPKGDKDKTPPPGTTTDTGSDKPK